MCVTETTIDIFYRSKYIRRKITFAASSQANRTRVSGVVQAFIHECCTCDMAEREAAILMKSTNKFNISITYDENPELCDIDIKSRRRNVAGRIASGHAGRAARYNKPHIFQGA
jgi:hypothetical protein